jgi:copper transport protein
VALPYATEAHAGAGALVEPTRPGPVEIHLYTLSPAGAQIDVPEIDAIMSLPSAGISDLKVPLQKTGPGHFLAYGFDIPLRGTWKLQMTVRTHQHRRVQRRPCQRPHPLKLPGNFSAPPNDYLGTTTSPPLAAMVSA